MAKSAVTAALSSAAKAAAGSDDLVAKVRAKLVESRELAAEIANVEERLRDLSARMTAIRSEELPSLFEEAGLDVLGIDAEGNLPGIDAKLVPYYSASLPDDERREKAFRKFRWLEDLTKNRFTADLGRGDAKKAKALESALRKLKVGYTNKVSVHASTLTAEIRRRFESGKPLPPADLELLGAHVGRIVKLETRKAQ